MHNRQVIVLAILASVLSACGEDSEGSTDMFSLFSRKPKKTATVIDPALKAELKPLDSFPGSVGERGKVACKVTALRVEGGDVYNEDFSKLSFVQSKNDLAYGETAFVVEGLAGGPFAIVNLLIANESTQRLRVLRVQPGNPARPTGIVTAGQPLPDTTATFATQVDCISQTRLLIGLTYDQRTQRDALVTFDVTTSRYEKVADVTGYEGDMRQLWRRFDTRHLAPDVTAVLHYSERVRNSINQRACNTT